MYSSEITLFYVVNSKKIFFKRNTWWKITRTEQWLDWRIQRKSSAFKFPTVTIYLPWALTSDSWVISWHLPRGPKSTALKVNTGMKTTHIFCQKVRRPWFTALKQWVLFATHWTKPRSRKSFNCWLTAHEGSVVTEADSPRKVDTFSLSKHLNTARHL